MWHRGVLGNYQWGRSRAQGMRRLGLVTVFLAIGLTCSTAFSQDSAPPLPPDAQPSSPLMGDSGQNSGQNQGSSQNSVRAVRLSDVEGQVQVFHGEQTEFDQAEPNMPAVEGMRFVTGSNGRLEIEFEDGSVARVTPNSSIQLTELRRNDDGSTVTAIDALTGLTYYELNGRGGQISVRYAGETATAQGSAVFRVELDAAPLELAVIHGAVHVSDGQSVDVVVHPSETLQTDPQQPGQFTVAQNITADSWDQWNSDRDEALAALESDETTARASSGDPDDAAWNDLDYYGNWYNLAGYGQVWAPAGVGPGWDPFAVGYWGYYPAFGYTWISGYPWGWWPYHCGAWDFDPGWGWLWIPNNCGWGFYGAGWFPYATVWRMPLGYLPPMRPRHGPGKTPLREPLVAVNRGSQFSAPFHFAPGQRPGARPLTFEGRTIAPLTAAIHPLQKGPMGESFTMALVRTHPEMAPPAGRAPGLPGYRTYVAPAGTRSFGPSPASGARPSGSYAAPRPYTGASRPAYSGGAAPHPAPPPPAPHPSAGPAPHR